MQHLEEREAGKKNEKKNRIVERWAGDRLINAAWDWWGGGGVGSRGRELIKKNRRGHAGTTFIIIFFNRCLCMKWKTITSSSKILYQV